LATRDRDWNIVRVHITSITTASKNEKVISQEVSRTKSAFFF